MPRRQPRRPKTLTLHLPGGGRIEYNPNRTSIRILVHCLRAARYRVRVQLSSPFGVHIAGATVKRIGTVVLAIWSPPPAEPKSSSSLSTTDKSPSSSSYSTDESTWVSDDVDSDQVDPYNMAARADHQSQRLCPPQGRCGSYKDKLVYDFFGY